MLFIENVKLAFSAIGINKMRSFLTMLGIIIGISAVIAIVSIGDTMRGVIADQFAGIGVGRIYTYIQASDGVADENSLFSKNDIDNIRTVFSKDIEYISGAGSQSGTAIKGRNSVSINLTPVQGNYTRVQPVKISGGRMINQKDFESSKNNIVLDENTAEKLFKSKNVSGKTIRLSYNGKNGAEITDFTVVGTFENNKSVLEKLLAGKGPETAYIPESLVFTPDSSAFSLDIFISKNADSKQFKKSFINYISRTKNQTAKNIVYESAESEMKSADSIMQKLSLAVGAIAAISLLVGGIGIMNIMLVSVTERTREIGIRKALGARTADILIQFLTEAALISAAGGIIGTAIGIGVVAIGGRILNIKVIINPVMVITAVCFSAAVGIFFGLFPARKAAMKDPIEALRYE